MLISHLPLRVNCKPLLRISYILGRTLCVVLRDKNLIQIGSSSRGSYWQLHMTLTSGQAAFKFGSLDVSISWFFVGTENIFPRQRPRTDTPWSELSHSLLGFFGYSSDWSQTYSCRRLKLRLPQSMNQSRGRGPQRTTGELLLMVASRCHVGRNVSCLLQGRFCSLLQKRRLA